MGQSGLTRMAVSFMLLGSVLTLAIIGAGYVVYRYASRGPTAFQTAAIPTQEASPTADPLPSEDPQVETASAEPSPAEPPTSSSAESGPPAKAGTPTDEATEPAGDAVADEPAEARAAPEAPPPEDPEKALQRERDHLERKFNERKAQFMAIIDTYLALPLEERPDYLMRAMEEWRQQAEAERLAEGLPARPRNQAIIMREMMGMMRDNLTEDEKKKVTTFFGDVMQMQMARIQTEMERQLHTPPNPAPPPDLPQGGNPAP